MVEGIPCLKVCSTSLVGIKHYFPHDGKVSMTPGVPLRGNIRDAVLDDGSAVTSSELRSKVNSSS
jgi:hypothetical protein